MVNMAISEKKQKEIYEAFERNRQIVERMPEFTYEIGDEGRKVTFIRDIDQDEECTCRPDSVEACPACKVDSARRHGSEIPF